MVFLATRGLQYDKVISNIEEVRARGGRMIAVATEGDEQSAPLFRPHHLGSRHPRTPATPLERRPLATIGLTTPPSSAAATSTNPRSRQERHRGMTPYYLAASACGAQFSWLPLHFSIYPDAPST